MTNYLLVDIGSTYTKLTAVNLRLTDVIAAAQHPTTVDADLRIGTKRRSRLKEKKTGIDGFKKI